MNSAGDATDLYRSLLRSVELFQDLPDSDLTGIAKVVRKRKYKAGVYLFSAGDEGDRLFIVIDGAVRIERDTESGRTLHIATILAGQHFGEMALLDGEPRMAGALTLAPCELLTLDRENFLKVVAEAPQIALTIIGSLARRLRRSADEMETRNELDVTGRLAVCLLQLAETEGVEMPDGVIVLNNRHTHDEIADMVGSVRETVTRALRDLESAHVIEAAGKPTVIKILKPDKLRSRAGR